jgi:hypothetical protein
MYPTLARRIPVVLFALPFCLLIASLFPPTLWTEGVLASGVVVLGIGFFLSELGRDLGYKKQPALWRSWGGAPTMQMLRHRNPLLDPATRLRYHTKLATRLAVKLPTSDEEELDPDAADAVYDSCVKHLLEHTRDKEKFPLVLQENISYGFRRNLWGMKPAGILLSLIGTAGCGTIVAYRWTNSGELPSIPCAGVLLSALFLSLWIFRIKPDWVRLGAEAYAKRLLASCEVL